MNTVEYERQKQLILERNSQNPIYRRLNKSVAQLKDVLDWTIDHIAVPFTWPTRYNEPGQEHIVFDEDKEKVTLDVQNNNYNLEELGRAELQDIVLGWIKHVRLVNEEQRQPTDFTPMAEYELWRVLEIKYNTFLEQLKHPFVRQTVGKDEIHLMVVLEINSPAYQRDLHNISLTDKLDSYSRTEEANNDDTVCADETVSQEMSNQVTGEAASGSRNDRSVLEDWRACVDELKENYVLANENFKYLGTLQEFLIVSRDERED